jgi:flagellar basal-body rod modification protein FlgD
MAVEVIRDRYLDNTEIINGVRYTTQEDPNKLTNNDFLELMLEELKNQDPTKPQDSSALMDSQLKMSQIETNTDMALAMEKLSASYQSSNLSTASNLIGHIIEDGQGDGSGTLYAYKVASVKQVDGDVIINANKVTSYDADTNTYTFDSEFSEIPLIKLTKIF